MLGQCWRVPRSGVLCQPALHSRPSTCYRRGVVMAAIAGAGCRVAVIGAGAGGLVAARELLKEGHSVVVFEQGTSVGGVWSYTPAVESDLLGAPNRTRVHSSMYAQLRTNLPREIMAFTDFPFVSEAMNLAAEAQGTFHSSGSNSTLSSGGKQQAQELAPCSSVDQRRFCSHTEVLRYLAAFASFYQLHQHIQLGTQVTSVELIPDTANHSPAGAQCNGTAPQQVETNGGERNSDGTTQQRRRRPRFRVHTAPAALEPQQQLQRGQVQPQQQQASHWLQPSEVHEVDAVVVANGHYSEPSLPRLPGLQASQEAGVLHLHAHNYRHPGQFGPNLAQQTVLIVGASNSGEDISRELSPHAGRVLVSARSWQNPAWAGDTAPYGAAGNVTRRPLVAGFTGDGRALFPDGSSERVDIVIYATGYRYTFPFLESLQHQQQQQQQQGGIQGQGQEHGVQNSQSQPMPPLLSPIQPGQDLIPDEDGKPPVVATDGEHVRPLYLDLFPPSCAPWISFPGLPWKIVPFPQMELQARLVAQALAGKVELPPQEEMLGQAQAEYQAKRAAGVPNRHMHMQGNTQFPYNDQLSRLMGEPPLPSWRQEMYMHTSVLRRASPESYRDLPLPPGSEGTQQQMQEDIAAQVAALRKAMQTRQQSSAVSDQVMHQKQEHAKELVHQQVSGTA